MIRLIFIFSCLLTQSHGSSIVLHKEDAVVWHPVQLITGELSMLEADEVIVHHNENSFPVEVKKLKFAFQLTLRDTENRIWVEVANDTITSDTLRLTLGYRPQPIIKPVAKVTDSSTVLQANLIENPYGSSISYLWLADSLNPATCKIINAKDSIAEVEIPKENGVYNFNLLVVAEKDSSWYRTFVKRDKHGLNAFKFDSAYPQWMDTAIVYQILPYSFVQNGSFDAIRAKLPELKKLGINTILLQPVYESHFGWQGYDVTDYFSVNPDLGTEEELKQLVKRAHELKLKVLFDVVLNHSSIHHPYAENRKKFGDKSHYYNFYQHIKDNKPYSSFYTADEWGFINYFWDNLVNLNYQNKEVRRWMLQVCKFWVRAYDIDGYRFDAIWGVNARRPSFARRLRTELKSIKPDILMLAEDKGSDPEVYELGFDAAYDWTRDTTWVSQWPWEYKYEERKSHTIFRYPDAGKRGEMLSQALFSTGGNEHRKLRYIENNDLPRFIKTHGLRQTKMAAALLFSLPGIPMLFNGQEIGYMGHPYSDAPVFHRDSSIQSMDTKGLFIYYQKLIKIHKRHPALSDTKMSKLSLTSKGANEGAMLAFHRWEGQEKFVIVVNMDSLQADANINIRKLIPEDSRPRKYRLKDKLVKEKFKVRKDPTQVKIPMAGYSVRWLHLEK